MLRKIVCSLALVFAVIPLSYANRAYVIDTPSVNMLDYGFYDVGLRFSSDGSLLTKCNFGVSRRFNIGLSWELNRFIGEGGLSWESALPRPSIPVPQVKFKIYEGNMTYPAVAVGCDLQGCFFYGKDGNGCLQKGPGIYLVAGREFFIENLMLNIGVSFNGEIHGFTNLTVPLYKEIVFFMTEYDDINTFSFARFNFGLRVALTECINIEYVIRDFWLGDSVKDRFFNEKVFKISYTIKF